MNAYEYLDRANIFALQHPELRIGQAMMCCLQGISPIAYVSIPDHISPFYDDELVKPFIKYVIMNWSSLTRPIHQPA